ncbi:MAG: exonuclease domain-containing protein [Methylovirgula sp.]
MSGFSPFITTIDFETTALSKDADVIEVGVAIFDRQETLRTWSSLVRPSPNCRWSEKAEQVHKIARVELEQALDPAWVACKLNQVMTGVTTAYCDGYQFDRVWMGNLFHEARVEPAFSIAPIEEMPRMHLNVVRDQMNAYLNRTLTPHRAGEDALRLMRAYLYAIGKQANVVAVS